MTKRDGNTPVSREACHAMIHVFGADGEVRSIPADQGTQERWESARRMILEKLSEHAGRVSEAEPTRTGPRLVLRGEPDLFDVAAWRQRLEDLKSDDPSEFRDAMIDHARAHLAAIERADQASAERSQKTATEPRSGSGQ